MRDVAYKYNIMLHSSLNTSPHIRWHGTPPQLTKLFTFGKLGTVPVYSRKSKLQPRADPARYIFPQDHANITILNLRTLRYQRLRCIDFRPYNKNQDPVYQTRHAFAIAHHPIPNSISHTTCPPRSLAQARSYPDSALWAKAHNAELDSLDQNGVILWKNHRALPHQKPISLTMTYKIQTQRFWYSHGTQGSVRCPWRHHGLKRTL